MFGMLAEALTWLGHVLYPALPYIRLVALVPALGAWALFSAEAWKRSKAQFLLCVILPFYAFYFAFIKSGQPWPFRAALSVGTALLLLPS